MSRFVRLLLSSAHRRFQSAAMDPERAQKKVWQEVLRGLQRGSYWKGKMPSQRLEDFPITDYDQYSSALDQAFETSKRSPLNGEKIAYWGLSSGTTGKQKPFALTRSHSRQISRSGAATAYGRMTQFPRSIEYATIIPCVPDMFAPAPTGIGSGYVSTHGYRELPFLLENKFAIPKALVESVDLFNEWSAVYALAADVGTMTGLTPLSVAGFLNELEASRDRLLAVLQGKLALPRSLPPLRISPDRKKHLLKILGASQFPSEIQQWWPNLQFLSTWQSSISESQMGTLSSRVSPKLPWIETPYVATEAYFTVAFPGAGQGGVLNCAAHVVEFLPLGEEPRASALRKPWEIEEGKFYELILSNAMGFVRYRIKDVVKCLGFMEKAPVISFQFKTDQCLSLDYSTLSVTELLSAFQSAMGSEIKRFDSPEVFFQPGEHADRVEVVADDRYTVDPGFLSRFDQALKKANEGYRLARDRDAIEGPQLQAISSRSEKWLKFQNTSLIHQRKRVYIAPIRVI